MPVRVPDRRARSARPCDRRRPVHQLPHHRAARRARAVGGVSHRRLDLRLRRVPGVCPVNAGLRRQRTPARPAAAAHRLAAAARQPRLRPGCRGIRAASGRPASAAAQRDRRPRQRGMASVEAVKLLERAAADRRPEVRTQALRVLDARAQEVELPQPSGIDCTDAPSLRPPGHPLCPRPSFPMPCRAGPPPRRRRGSTAGDRRSSPRPHLPAVRRHQRRGAPRASRAERPERGAARVQRRAGPACLSRDPLAAWLADGTLERRAEPSAYYYRHGTAVAPDDLTVEGVVVRVLLDPWGDGVRPTSTRCPGRRRPPGPAAGHAGAAEPDPGGVLRSLRAVPARDVPRVER